MKWSKFVDSVAFWRKRKFKKFENAVEHKTVVVVHKGTEMVDKVADAFLPVIKKLHFPPLGEEMEEMIYKEVIDLVLHQLQKLLSSLSDSLNGSELWGHAIQVTSKHLEHIPHPKPSGKSLGTNHLHMFIGTILLDDNVNVWGIPDFIERDLYFNCACLALELLRSLLDGITIRVLDHEINIQLDALDKWDPTSYESRLDDDKLSAAVKEMLKHKNKIMGTLEHALLSSVFKVLLGLIDHILHESSLSVLGCVAEFVITPEKSDSPQQSIPPPSDKAVTDFVKQHLMDDDCFDIPIFPRWAEIKLYSELVSTIMKPLCKLLSQGVGALASVELWGHHLQVLMHPEGPLPPHKPYEYLRSSMIVRNLARLMVDSGNDLYGLPEDLQVAVFVNCIVLAMELLNHLVSQIFVEFLGCKISVTLQPADSMQLEQMRMLRTNVQMSVQNDLHKGKHSLLAQALEFRLLCDTRVAVLGMLETTLSHSSVQAFDAVVEARVQPLPNYKLNFKPESTKEKLRIAAGQCVQTLRTCCCQCCKCKHKQPKN